MTRDQAEASIQAGMDEVAELPESPFALLALGEMGIGNSAVAALLVCALSGLSPEAAVGPGTGVQGEALRNKAEIVSRVLAYHHLDPADPIGVLASVGGAEFGAMTGAMLPGAAVKLGSPPGRFTFWVQAGPNGVLARDSRMLTTLARIFRAPRATNALK